MSQEVKRYPIAEVFTSPQGEGLYTGTIMTFIRFAGCTVGKPINRGVFALIKDQSLPIWQEECTTYDGRKFLCDTNFKKHMSLSCTEALKLVPNGVKHLCLTGGEPLMHNLRQFVFTSEDETFLHIETSGTIPAPQAFGMSYEELSDWNVWLTVSPKLGVLDDMLFHADEIKLLVDEGFDWEKVPARIKSHELVWLMPINDTYEIDPRHLDLCKELQLKYPNCRLGQQMHKIWRVR